MDNKVLDLLEVDYLETRIRLDAYRDTFNAIELPAVIYSDGGLAESLCDECSFSKELAVRFIASFFEEIEKELYVRERVPIDLFGTFYRYPTPPRKITHKRTKVVSVVPGMLAIKFKTSPKFKALVFSGNTQPLVVLEKNNNPDARVKNKTSGGMNQRERFREYTKKYREEGYYYYDKELYEDGTWHKVKKVKKVTI